MNLFNFHRKTTTTLASTLLGVAIDVSGSMQTNIRNSQMMDLSRLGGVEKGLSALLNDSRTVARKYGSNTDLPLRVFAYAFGLNVNPAYADLLTILRFAKDIEKNTEFKAYMDNSIALRRREAEQKGEQMRRNAERQYGGLANLARSYGFGSLVDSVTRTAEEDARKEFEPYRRMILNSFNKEPGDTLFHFINAFSRAANLIMLAHGIPAAEALRKRLQLQKASVDICESVIENFTQGKGIFELAELVRKRIEI